MPGPIINMPGALVPIFDYTMQAGSISDLHLKQDWAQYFHNLGNVAIGSTRSGSTSVRPTSTMPRWIGLPYFDQQINRELFLQSVNPDVWFDPVSTAVATATSAAIAAIKSDPSVAKAWCILNQTGVQAYTATYGVSGAPQDDGVGKTTITLSTPMSSANFVVLITGDNSGARFNTIGIVLSKTTSTCSIMMEDDASSAVDAAAVHIAVFGAQ